MEFRTCCKCKISKPINQFHKRNLVPSGIRGICKDCRKKYEKHYPENVQHKAQYFQDNFDKISKQHKNYWKIINDKIFSRLGERCVKCGFSDRRALQIDHINGDGGVERRKISRYTMLRQILELSDSELFSKYQILCANCNMIKKIENNELRKKLRDLQ